MPGLSPDLVHPGRGRPMKICYGCQRERRIPKRVAPFCSTKCAVSWALDMTEERMAGWCRVDKEWHAGGEYCTVTGTTV
jgi:hypothetical protein